MEEPICNDQITPDSAHQETVYKAHIFGHSDDKYERDLIYVGLGTGKYWGITAKRPMDSEDIFRFFSNGFAEKPDDKQPETVLDVGQRSLTTLLESFSMAIHRGREFGRIRQLLGKKLNDMTDLEWSRLILSDDDLTYSHIAHINFENFCDRIFGYLSR